jgi:lysine-N-methylase
MPSYVQRFACIGAACEDTCCAGWTVTIDKKTYQAYRHIPKSRLSGRLATEVKRLPESNSEASYALIGLVPVTGECPMLEERLCAVQKELGEDKLSNTCFSYPRKSTQAGGVMQQTLTLSCPEAARLALLSADAFDFLEAEIPVRLSTVDHLLPRFGLTVEQMNDIRFFCVQIVRTEGLNLWQKIAILGVFCESLTQALNDGSTLSVDDLIQTSHAFIVNGEGEAMCSGIVAQPDIQALTFNLLWRFAWPTQIRPQHAQVFHAVDIGMGADPVTGEVVEETLISRYREGLSVLPAALGGAPAFMSNYVLNEMLRETFPFGSDCESPKEHYLRLATRFGLVRFMMAVQCRPDQPSPDLATLTSTVQVFARRFQHDIGFAKKVDNCFTNAGWHRLEKIFRLVKP